MVLVDDHFARPRRMMYMGYAKGNNGRIEMATVESNFGCITLCFPHATGPIIWLLFPTFIPLLSQTGLFIYGQRRTDKTFSFFHWLVIARRRGMALTYYAI